MQPERRDSIANTFVVSLVLCIVCSLMVSTAAVALKKAQSKNKLLDRQRNILRRPGWRRRMVWKPSRSRSFSAMGRSRPSSSTCKAATLSRTVRSRMNRMTNAKQPRKQLPAKPVDADRFPIGIDRRERYTWVYLIKGDDGKLDQVVLPIYGKGLWSTMYGFVASRAT